jgi:N-acetylglucosaminyl-diphospho-decaprenol L-rhamnosyltransferase
MNQETAPHRINRISMSLSPACYGLHFLMHRGGPAVRHAAHCRVSTLLERPGSATLFTPMPAKLVQFPPVTVSIVSHRQWSLVEPLLEQLDRWCGTTIAAVVLTFNLPEDVTLNGRWRFAVQRIDNAQPRGFGANHNAAFLRCRTPWFLVLNPDVRLEDDVLWALLSRASPRAGLVTPRIREPGSEAAEPYRALLTPLELVRRRMAGYRPPPVPAWVAGMFILIRHEAFAHVDGFDERYFMYCEDFDLCARLRLAGWKIQAERSVTVMHLAQRASQAALRPLLWHLTSFIKVWTSGAFWRYRKLLKREAASS